MHVRAIKWTDEGWVNIRSVMFARWENCLMMHVTEDVPTVY